MPEVRVPLRAVLQAVAVVDRQLGPGGEAGEGDHAADGAVHGVAVLPEPAHTSLSISAAVSNTQLTCSWGGSCG